MKPNEGDQEVTADTETKALDDWPTEWLPARRRWAAWHEAAHSLAQICLGVPALHATIVEGGHQDGHLAFLGFASSDGDPIPLDIGRCGLGTLEQPPAFRDWCERHMVICLAGAIGSAMSGPIEGRLSMVDADFDERAAHALARRSERIRELRAAAEATPTDDDEQKALKASAALNSPDMTPTMTSHAHVDWLRYETRDLLQRHAAHLEALATALNKAVEMDGPAIEAIVYAIPCDCHTWPEVTP